jgi:Zn-dependent peptidase ImmA (M78 family)
LISLCENAKKRDPAPDLVQACGEVLGFEPSFFYGKVEDNFTEEECSFRHRRGTPERTKKQIRAHATLIGMVVDKLRGHFKFPTLNIPSIPAPNEDEIEGAAERARQHWQLGLDGPILQIGRVLEHAGVIIVSHLVQSTKVDAFSRQGKTTMIFLNRSVASSSRWNFDIAHECGHLVLHQGVLTGSSETESAADRFASAFLMPRRAFSREFRSSPFSWRHIFDLKRRWQTSAASIIRRAYDLRLIGAADYRRSFQYLSYKKWNKGEPDEPIFQEPELLRGTLAALGRTVDLTPQALCSELKFQPETFEGITGVPVPSPIKKRTDVLPFKLA